MFIKNGKLSFNQETMVGIVQMYLDQNLNKTGAVIVHAVTYNYGTTGPGCFEVDVVGPEPKAGDAEK